MRSRRTPDSRNRGKSEPSALEMGGVRIIGGRLRGKSLTFLPDADLRPMKDRVREALFNLIGPAVVGSTALDLFGGTGILGIESVSRGAERALVFERHFPTAKSIQRQVDRLELTEEIEVIPGDVFVWVRRLVEGKLTHPDGTPDDRLQSLSMSPWVVFISPPYAFYVERAEEMLGLIARLAEHAPAGSVLAVESDERFDPGQLPGAEAWSTRTYAPAVISLRRL